MTRDEANVLFAARDAMWGSGDIHALASLHAEDGIIISPLFGIIKGLPAIEKSYREIFKIFNDLTLTTERSSPMGIASRSFSAHAPRTRARCSAFRRPAGSS